MAEGVQARVQARVSREQSGAIEDFIGMVLSVEWGGWLDVWNEQKFSVIVPPCHDFS